MSKEIASGKVVSYTLRHFCVSQIGISFLWHDRTRAIFAAAIILSPSTLSLHFL